MGNQNSGRRPQPTALTVLRGNPSRKKSNKNEPSPRAGDVTKPAEGLSVAGGLVWDELSVEALAMGTLTVADLRAFATLCELQATFQRVVSFKGTENFDAKLERDTATALHRYYELFGLTPVSRARIQVPKSAEEPVSKWAGVLK